MLNAYLNYPNSKVTIHRVAGCPTIGQMRKRCQRWIQIDAASRATELAKFEGAHGFGATAEVNDMWVVVSLGNPQEEAQVVADIKRALGRRYAPFRNARVDTHC